MDIVVRLSFVQAWETLNGIEQRLEILGRHAERYPESDEIVGAMGRLIAARDAIRESMGLVEQGMAQALIASVTPDLPDIPLAAFDPETGSHDPIPDALVVYWNRGA
jgi:hypothetical protein